MVQQDGGAHQEKRKTILYFPWNAQKNVINKSHFIKVIGYVV